MVLAGWQLSMYFSQIMSIEQSKMVLDYTQIIFNKSVGYLIIYKHKSVEHHGQNNKACAFHLFWECIFIQIMTKSLWEFIRSQCFTNFINRFTAFLHWQMIVEILVSSFEMITCMIPIDSTIHLNSGSRIMRVRIHPSSLSSKLMQVPTPTQPALIWRLVELTPTAHRQLGKGTILRSDL